MPSCHNVLKYLINTAFKLLYTQSTVIYNKISTPVICDPLLGTGSTSLSSLVLQCAQLLCTLIT
jgi:hypothetical protein